MYEAVIGLEIHSQLLTETKLFCRCSTRYDSPPNTNVCPVCLGLPGALPVMNKQAAHHAVLAATSFNLSINRRSYFARKNYFYPDLPKGYQITQYETPVSQKGYIDVNGKRIRINRIHIEEDAGKSIHMESPSQTKVDFNRSGIALIEIVTEPDIENPQQAVEFLQILRLTLMYLGISDGNMEEGSLRCDGNISVREKGAPLPDYKVEIKNLNSFRFLAKALEYEFKQQVKMIGNNEKIQSCTKLWDTKENKTRLMRRKEEEFDYRYFPEPDLGALVISQEEIDLWQTEIPELPQQKRDRFEEYFKMDAKAASFYMFNTDIADFFEATAKLTGNFKKIDSWLRTELMKVLKEENIALGDLKFTPELLCQLIHMVDSDEITGKIAKEIYRDVLDGKAPKEIVKKKGIQTMDNRDEIERMLLDLIAASPKEVNKYKGGHKKMAAYFVGRIMGQTKGQANPKTINELIKKHLDD